MFWFVSVVMNNIIFNGGATISKHELRECALGALSNDANKNFLSKKFSTSFLCIMKLLFV